MEKIFFVESTSVEEVKKKYKVTSVNIVDAYSKEQKDIQAGIAVGIIRECHAMLNADKTYVTGNIGKF